MSRKNTRNNRCRKTKAESQFTNQSFWTGSNVDREVNVRYGSEVEQFGRIDIHRLNLTNPDPYPLTVHEFQVYSRTTHSLRSTRVFANNQFNNPYLIINTIKLCVTSTRRLDARATSSPFDFTLLYVKLLHLLTQTIRYPGKNHMNTNNKVRWGILSTAKIGTATVIPAMQQGVWSQVDAIASRNIEHAEQVARALGIPKAYGSYEELLADEEIDAIYNPLPNDLHVPWTIAAAVAGKHVLCEKELASSYRKLSWSELIRNGLAFAN